MCGPDVIDDLKVELQKRRHLEKGSVGAPDRVTHGLPTIGHRCTVGVLAGTHRCDDSSRQDDESPKRQPYSAALHWGSAALH